MNMEFADVLQIGPGLQEFLIEGRRVVVIARVVQFLVGCTRTGRANLNHFEKVAGLAAKQRHTRLQAVRVNDFAYLRLDASGDPNRNHGYTSRRSECSLQRWRSRDSTASHPACSIGVVSPL